jgi:soluble lytic murein transglycosylase
MTSADRVKKRRGLTVGWPIVIGFVLIWLVSIAGIVQLANRSVDLHSVIAEQAEQIEMQSERIAYLEDRLRILEAVEDLQSRLTPSEEAQLASHVYELSETHDIPPLLLLAIINVESSFGTHAISHMGARGLMQVKPSTGRWIVSQTGADWPGDDRLFDPGFNLWLGTEYLAHLIDKFGSVEKAIVAYNWGETAVRQKMDAGQKLPSTYLRRVEKAYRKLERLYGSPSPGPFSARPLE